MSTHVRMDYSSCRICGEKCSLRGGLRSLTSHIKKFHSITVKDYYDRFYKLEGMGICKYCGNDSEFTNIGFHMYADYCSRQCSGKSSPLITLYNKDQIFLDRASVRSKELMTKTMSTLRCDPEFLESRSRHASNQLKNPESGFGKRRLKQFIYNKVVLKSGWEVAFAAL
jgi:hypothetical protein